MQVDDALSTGAIWLDLTRTLTRVGHGSPDRHRPGGACLGEAPSGKNPEMRGLCRTTRGFLLLPPDGVRALVTEMRMVARRWAGPIRWSRLTGRGERPRHRAEALLRGYAIDRCTALGPARDGWRHAVRTYVNAGHINHTDRRSGVVRQSGGRGRPDPRPDPDHVILIWCHPNSRPALPGRLASWQGPRLPGRRRVSKTRIRARSPLGATCQGPRTLRAEIGVPSVPDAASRKPRAAGSDGRNAGAT
jgi:hypothetical protein